MHVALINMAFIRAIFFFKEYATLFVPHPLKEKSAQSGGMPVIMVPLTVFTDDTSGN